MNIDKLRRFIRGRLVLSAIAMLGAANATWAQTADAGSAQAYHDRAYDGTRDEAHNRVRDTMRRATRFMVETVSYRGGYVWSYLPDFSRRWGEMEARPTMIWIQPPGTATMGHVFLDAYHATGDEYYYSAAEQVAKALMWGQHPSGGWNYLIDFGGEASIRDWYDTVGANGWRLEEFQHYYGNATFDDAGTSEASQFLLRLYVEKHDAKYKPALDRAIGFVLDSQYPVGGWPQRYPLGRELPDGLPDYTAYITLNDDVAAENIKFLIMCYQTLGEQRLLDPIARAMNAFLLLQQPQPQPAWGLQYTLDLKPAGARTYEPVSLTTHTTARVIDSLMDFYQLTGETKFLARIPEALDWLDAVRLPPELAARTKRTHPTFIAIGSNKPLYVHRRGSNVVNGEYYVHDNPDQTIGHYSSFRKLDVAALRQRYEHVKATPPIAAAKRSPLHAKGIVDLPRYFTTHSVTVSDLNVKGLPTRPAVVTQSTVNRLVAGLNKAGYWPTLLKATSNPYIGPGPRTATAGDYATTRVGDKFDTSPYIADAPVSGISIGSYIQNMSELIAYLDQPD